MLTLPPSVRIYLGTEATDMRKGHDGLAALVTARSQDVYSGHLFVFVNARRDMMKILHWDGGGFWIWYRQLDRRPRCKASCGWYGRILPPQCYAPANTAR